MYLNNGTTFEYLDWEIPLQMMKTIEDWMKIQKKKSDSIGFPNWITELSKIMSHEAKVIDLIGAMTICMHHE